MSELSKDDLLKEHEFLLRKVDELTGKLYHVNNKLKESEALKGHFISNITNEVINPFSSILVLAENLQQLGDNEMARAKTMASMIYDEAFHLDFQLKNIFVAAAIEAGKDDLKPVRVNLKHLFGNVIRSFKKQIDSKEITIKLDVVDENDDLISFVTDKDKLKLIVENLLDNAIKFSLKNGKIELRLSMEKRMFTFSVRDFGKGIPADKKQIIFDRFLQLDERISSVNTGHGLGLAIVNSQVYSLNGKLRLEELKGDGACFTVTIPGLEENEDWDDLDQFLIDPDKNISF